MAAVASLHDVPVATMRLPIDSLQPGVQLRVGKVDEDHLNAIMLCDGNWPPIIVRRDDNTIVDGHYRYLAASRLGHRHIECSFFDGNPESAFFEALRRNRDHGLPLSLRDREAAARQVIASHPEWSDRRIGQSCGLAPGTVGRLRPETTRTADQPAPLSVRLGRDGRRRPVDPSASRERIRQALRAAPGQSLREIARRTGTSPATVRSVKAREAELAEVNEPLVRPVTPLSPAAWETDAALHSTTEAETFTTWFQQTDITKDWQKLLPAIPVSRVYEVADEGRRRAAEWLAFAATVEERARGRHSLGA